MIELNLIDVDVVNKNMHQISLLCKNDLSMYRFFDRSRENLSRGAGRDFGRDSLGLRDGSEMVVSDACVKGKEVIYVQSISLFFWVEVISTFLYISCLFICAFSCFSMIAS